MDAYLEVSPKKRKKWPWVIGLSALALLIVAELTLRVAFGFCDAVLYRTDKNFEYIPIPQNRVRFGNRSFYNSFSQRNDEITPADSILIDGFGDSVLNGGTLIDQDHTATAKLTRYLSARRGVPVKVLNIAAGSWGPDNCFAYLRHYGDFHCKSMFLVVSSHDAFDDMTFAPTVGVDPEHPATQYTFALWELIDRYVWPRLLHRKKQENLFIDKRTPGVPFNTGFAAFFHYCDSAHIPLLVYLHAERGEVLAGQYDDQGQMIIDSCTAHHIPLVKELDYHLAPALYRDIIHFNDEGQERMFEILRDKVLPST
jgi:hypothetical protein